MLALRRQQHQEIATNLGDHDAAERQITDLYTKAADQLGSDNAPGPAGRPVRPRTPGQREPGAPADHRQCDLCVLADALRPAPDEDRSDAERARHDAAGRHPLRYQAARRGQQLVPELIPAGPDPHEERQVRLTAQRILATHLRPGAPAGGGPVFWQAITLDLTGATLAELHPAQRGP